MKNGKWDTLNWTNLSQQEQDILRDIRQKKYWDDMPDPAETPNTNAALMASGKGTLWRDLPPYLEHVAEKLVSDKTEMYLERFAPRDTFTRSIATYLAYFEALLDLQLLMAVVPPSSSYLEAIGKRVPYELLLLLKERTHEYNMTVQYANNGLEYAPKYRRTALFELVDLETGEIICG